MNIVKATKRYEAWLSERIPLIAHDLEEKHDRMAGDIFEFLRATFYRWMQVWPKQCPDLQSAPEVLSVGDLHTDNFGTWRDVEGRLIWGVNDFDEAFPLPYTADLVRLVTSAYLAVNKHFGSLLLSDISTAILAGYRRGLREGGRPFVLAERDAWLADLLLENLKDAERFWERLKAISSVSELPPPEVVAVKAAVPELPPPEVVEAVKAALPQTGLRIRWGHRAAGLGSLGRRRYLALMKYRQAFAAREAKELTASACLWASDDGGTSKKIYYTDLVSHAVRSPDPFLQVHDPWLVRRLSPDYVRLDFAELTEEIMSNVFQAMGYETANVHLGTKDVIKDIRKDLKARDTGWLSTAAETMLEATSDDFVDWVDYWQETMNSA